MFAKSITTPDNYKIFIDIRTFSFVPECDYDDAQNFYSFKGEEWFL